MGMAMSNAPSHTTVYRMERFFNSEQQKLLNDQRLDQRITNHISPYSTLIAAMGSYWQPGCLDSVKAMAKFTWDYGYEVCFYEEPDRCYSPFDAMGSMRNMAYMRAIREGWEYVLYVDNDVLPPPDTLVRLLQRNVPIITPIIVYSDNGDHGLSMPKMEQGKGLAMVGSTVLSCLLIRTSVFFPWATGGFWGNAIGDDEEYHFTKLEHAGHRPFVDTDEVVTCVTPPHFPLDAKRKERSIQSRL